MAKKSALKSPKSLKAVVLPTVKESLPVAPIGDLCEITEHPSGEGLVFTASGYDPLWMRDDGRIEELHPATIEVSWPGSSHRPAHDAGDGDIRQRIRTGTI